MNKISIIVPVYNAEKTIRRCVDSLLAQTHSELEVILVNDGSKDHSLDICMEYQEKYDNVLVFTKNNSGVSDTRNMGLKHATGAYVQFVDSDDFIDQDMSQKLLLALETKNADMAMCSMTVIKNQQKHSDNLSPGAYCNENIAKELIKIYKTNYINSPCNKLYKRDLIKSGFPSNISLGEDLLFNLNYLRNCKKIVCISDALYMYDYVNENSLVHSYRDNNFEIATLLYESVCNYAKSYQVSEAELQPVREVYINSFFYALQDLCYYSSLSHAERLQKISHWLDNTNLIECLSSTYQVGKQHQIICNLAKQKKHTGIYTFFKTKKFISSLRKKG